MFRAVVAFIAVLIGLEALAADIQVHRDLDYAGAEDGRRVLDLYTPGAGEGRPVLVWIHGGGWRRGDKSAVQRKPEACAKRGFLFVSVNYRLVPQVTVKQQAADVAQAIAWVHRHAKRYGGRPDTLFVAGHSAGAHLAALVCTDDRYLKAEGLPLSLIKGCIPIDTATYDIPKQIESVSPMRRQLYTGVFGTDKADQQELSPIAYVAKEKAIPPFLILHVADRPDSRTQSEAFAKTLVAAGVEVKVFPAKGKTHATINRELGRPGDEPTKALSGFLEERLKETAQ